MSFGARSVFVRNFVIMATILALPGLAASAANHGRAVQTAHAKSAHLKPAARKAKPDVTRQLVMPMMNPARGRILFATKGCVACHAVNGIGGKGAPALDAKDMDRFMNPFDFAAKMWAGAPTMALLQEEVLGEQIQFTGDELADIIAFAHSVEGQRKFTLAEIPKRIVKLMKRAHSDDAASGPHGGKHGKHKRMH